MIYDFDGFFRPVDMGDTVNSVKAGSAVPIKFSLDGDQGLGIIASGYPKINRSRVRRHRGRGCDRGDGQRRRQQPELRPDRRPVRVRLEDGQELGRPCGTFTLKLDDGTVHTADFQFKK